MPKPDITRATPDEYAQWPLEKRAEYHQQLKQLSPEERAERRVGRREWSTEKDDRKTDVEVEEWARKNLAELGLTMDDLVGKRVLDLGAGSQLLERAAQQVGIGTVYSVERALGALSKRPEVDRGAYAEAGQLPFANGSMDLVVSLGAAITLAKDQGHLKRMLKEIGRVLNTQGEARVTPQSLYFLREQLLTPELRAIEKRSRDASRGQNVVQPTPDELRALKQALAALEPVAREQSGQLMREQGFDVIAPQTAGGKSNYWILRPLAQAGLGSGRTEVEPP